MSLIIYHNPSCSKSRATLELLQERGLKPEIVHYLDTPPDPVAPGGLARRLGLRPPEAVLAILEEH